MKVPPREDFHTASITTGEDSPYPPSPMGMAGMESAISTKVGGDSPEYLSRVTDCWGEYNAIWTIVTRTVVDAERGCTDPGSVATCPAVIRTVPYRIVLL